jgi:hypothetical protein
MYSGGKVAMPLYLLTLLSSKLQDYSMYLKHWSYFHLVR